MRLLLLNHNLRDHGTYFRAAHFGRQLVRRGHSVTLLTASPDHWYRAQHGRLDGMEIIETPSWNPWFNRDDGFGPIDWLYRSAFVLRRRWDALFAFAHPPNVLMPYWIWRLTNGGPVAVDWCDLYGGREGIVGRRRRLLREHPEGGPRTALARAAQRAAWWFEPRAERHMALRAPRLTVISRYLERRALRMGVERRRLMRLPGGAPTDVIRPQDKAECRRRLGIKDATRGLPVAVYTANYHPDEDFFLESLARARQSGGPFRLYAVGTKFSPGAVQRRGLDDLVVEVGRIDFADMEFWLGAADILLIPYPDNQFNRSRWPNKIGDHLAAGRPTVTNRTGDFAPLFARHDIGIASEGTPDAYGDAIAEALSTPLRWGTWGANALELGRGALSWEQLARRLEGFWLGGR